LKGKYFGVFVTSGGGKSQKATVQMRSYLDGEGMLFLGQMSLRSKNVDEGNYGEVFDFFVKKFNSMK
jgi:hypothetical protein